jgi:hypothetical protein
MEFQSHKFGTKLLMAIVVSSTLALAACGGGSSKPKPVDPPPVDEPDPVQPPEVSEDLTQVVVGPVFNKKDGTIVDVVDLAFKENGATATNIVDIDGNTVTNLTTSDGSFEVSVAQGADITGFTVVASAEGYLNQSTFIEVAADAESITAEIELAPAVAVDNVSTTQAEAAVTDATSAEVITVNTDTDVAPEEDTTVGNAEVAVEAGTQLQDTDGNAVDGSSVTVEVAFIEEVEEPTVVDPAAPVEEEPTTVAESLPAGLNEVEDEATAEEVSVPLAAATVNVTTDTGADVKKFSEPITITFNMPATTFIRSLDRNVQEGDSFAVKSFDEDTGVWLIEPNNAVVGAANGDIFPAEFKVDHLTTFAVTDRVPACKEETVISFTGDAVPAGVNLNVRLRTRDLTETFTSRGGATVTITPAQAKRSGISANVRATSWRVRDADRNTWGEVVSNDVVCGGTVTIPVTNPIPETVDETLELVAECSNDTTVTTALTGALVKYRLDATKPFKSAPGNGDGTYNLSGMVSGSSYAVEIDTRLDTAESRVVSTSITADGTTETVRVPLACSTGTGAG